MQFLYQILIYAGNCKSKESNMGKTLVALSGGVDSSAAAYLLRKEGKEIGTVFLRHFRQPSLTPEATELFWESAPENKRIPVWTDSSFSGGDEIFWNPALFRFPAEAVDAFRMARHLDVPFFFYDAVPVFHQVIGNWVSEYLQGRTPNPCVFCNRILKFGSLLAAAVHRGYSAFSTGHYIRVLSHSEWLESFSAKNGKIPEWLQNVSGEDPALVRGCDKNKDQSYVLYGIVRTALPFLRFPLAELTKPEVRKIALEAGLPVAEKKESQDLCFTDSPAEFLREQIGSVVTAGNFVSNTGQILGEHPGYERYTVGQRKGLGIGFGERVFVQRIIPERREVVLGSREDLARTEVAAADFRGLLDLPVEKPFRGEVKIRYRSPAVGAVLTISPDRTIRAVLDEPRYGAAPGQSLVCYLGDRLLGGGIIQQNE